MSNFRVLYPYGRIDPSGRMKDIELATLLKNTAEQGSETAIKKEQPVPDQLNQADTSQILLTDRNSKPRRFRIPITYLPACDR
ncbi:hypothetical protein [Sphingobacterium sp. 1.A.5]|uniref:hypothetical protein n=1 Tax=Sphingobacterium sp. 1.A.5 TaxID=2044604 RepID=UPI001C556C0B|nr:hypothetical protein [Sphingobacterium sp. 1.A.5]